MKVNFEAAFWPLRQCDFRQNHLVFVSKLFVSVSVWTFGRFFFVFLDMKVTFEALFWPLRQCSYRQNQLPPLKIEFVASISDWIYIFSEIWKAVETHESLFWFLSTFQSALSAGFLWGFVVAMQCRNKLSIFCITGQTIVGKIFVSDVFQASKSIGIPRYVRLLLTRSGWLRLWLTRVILLGEF